jgi:hypothetical protein
MLTGVEILLERMKTNPEEFIEGGLSKWSRVIDAGWEVLGEEERNALQDAIRSAKREHFNGEVMRVLSGNVEEEPTVEERFYKHKQLMQGDRTTFSSPTKIVSSKSMLAQTTQILKDEMDKTINGTSPYQQRK